MADGPGSEAGASRSQQGFLPADAFERIRRRVPLVCIDLLPWRRFEQGPRVPLIERHQRSERTGWALVGGRIVLDETIAAAAARHLRETLGDGVRTERRSFARPDEVSGYQRGPGRAGQVTLDPSQHSVALNYCVEVPGDVRVGGEACPEQRACSASGAPGRAARLGWLRMDPAQVPEVAVLLGPLEIASGRPIAPSGSSLRRELPESSGKAPRDVLEDEIAAGLERAPCLVAFSGGRDSSALLALAQKVAVERRLPAPLAVTHRFPGIPAADEVAWQEQVVRHVGVADWCRLEHDGELGILGPVARDALARAGLLWPSNTHMLAPILELAGGGVVMTGTDGDGLFGAWAAGPVAGLLTMRARPTRRRLRQAIRVAAPRGARRVRYLRSQAPICPWLSGEASKQVDRIVAARLFSEPRAYRAYVRWWFGSRALELAEASMSRLAATYAATILNPLLSPRFVASLSRHARATDFHSRKAAMETLFGDLLPARVLARGTKAVFDSAYWSEESLRFASEWEPASYAGDVVDPERLKQEWMLGPEGDFRATTALQAAWLGLLR